MRVDKWLWSVRLSKTRSKASHDCSAGKVKRAGDPLKPSTSLKVGDTLEVPAPDNSYKRTIEVVQLIEKRVGAPIAQAAYLDHTPAEILVEAEKRRLAQKENRQTRKEGDQGRLTKRKRRLWEEGGGEGKFF
ncbi:MAG: ribosome-associated heat shock protein Hsp15 [Akkermansiaceae bacterium]|jgi:ribosome-associated heat shock protein Hsp15